MDSYLGNTVMKLALKEDPEEHRIALFILLLCACIVIGHLLEKNRWINESVTAIFIGLFTGTLILVTTKGRNSHILVFSEDLFFIYVLPPIIFNAGFQVKKKQFFRNFLMIMLFGAVGTVISFFIISLGSSLHLFKKFDIGFLDMGDYFALGAILSATDSVCTLQVLNQDETPLLYSLVFGEGVVNDATSIVLFKAFQRFNLSDVTSSNAIQLLGNFFYLFFTSTLLGVIVSVFSLHFLIFNCHIGSNQHSTDREVALMILMPYLSYMLAELCYLSGILTMFFCGIVMSHYTWHNVTESSRVTTKHTFATFSFVSEIFIFLYVGMDALDIEKWKVVGQRPWTSAGVSLILLGLVLVARAAFVFPLSFISNLTRKSQTDKVGFKQQVVTIWWAGLMRGAVSVALAYNQFTRSGHTQLQGNAIMITSTITIVLVTNVVFGLLTQPIVRQMLSLHDTQLDGIMLADSPLKSLNDPLIPGVDDSESDVGGTNVPRPTSLRMLLTTPTRSVHYYWRMFDDRYMRPVFGGRGFVPFIPGSPTERYIH
ncbi:sodium/hydrogen exchanger 2-like [Cucumis melo var. makuwa]|uniref:Sodium/hydrogen exchanger n=1 Tax=Cucumis melo var. makuwa TaxID=1194695 RepID=A0A5D3D3Z0_CUCMM|nr:sodium/hydrogen exchanger 2-like [Cucumis melo var. makuwa]